MVKWIHGETSLGLFPSKTNLIKALLENRGCRWISACTWNFGRFLEPSNSTVSNRPKFELSRLCGVCQSVTIWSGLPPRMQIILHNSALPIVASTRAPAIRVPRSQRGSTSFGRTSVLRRREWGPGASSRKTSGTAIRFTTAASGVGTTYQRTRLPTGYNLGRHRMQTSFSRISGRAGSFQRNTT